MIEIVRCIPTITLVSLLLQYVIALDTKFSDKHVKQVSSTARILRSLGYLTEDHSVAVQNGTYYLNLVRATNPYVNNGRSGLPHKEPLLFVHGIFVNANSFILNTEAVKPKNYTNYDINSLSIGDLQELLLNDPASKSLVFTALNFGYEVWLLNRRPTLESLYKNPSTRNAILVKSKNSTLDLASGTNIELGNSQKLEGFARLAFKNYWNFSLDEQAAFDIPETVDYVLSNTNQRKLTYIGHSAGSALFLMSLARRPELADKILKSLLWAPALYLKGDFNPLFRKFLYLLLPILVRISKPILPPYLVVPVEYLVGTLCHTKLAQILLCDPIFDFVLGAGDTQSMLQNFNAPNRFFDVISSHEGAQLLQASAKGKMHYYEYVDEAQNIIAYSQLKPPLYDVSKIRLNTISIWSGISDIVVPIEDADLIISDLNVTVDRHIIDGPGVLFNHISFYINDNINNLLIIPSLKTIGAK